MKNHIITKPALFYPDLKTKCSSCEKAFRSYYSLQKYELSEHGKQSWIQDHNLDLNTIMKDYRNPEPHAELTTCKHFLVNSELHKSRQHVLNFASNYIHPTFLKDKLQHAFESLNCAAKIFKALRFVVCNVEGGNYRYLFAHDNNLVLERSQHIAKERTFLELQKSVNDLNIVELSVGERSSTNWKFFMLQTWRFLQHCGRAFLWVLKMICYYLTLSNVYILFASHTRQAMNVTTTIYVYWGLFACTGQEEWSRRKKQQFLWMHSPKSFWI